ncbi:MAG TPA: NUDIX hydrolase [bacterium]
MTRPVRTLRRQVLYRGRVIRLIRETIEVRGRRMMRETVEHPGAVRAHLLELPAGTLEPGERPASCARRELEEETGWRASRLRRLGEHYSAPGFTSERMIVYLAQQLRPGRAPHPDSDEMLEPVRLPLRRALAEVRRGAIRDGKTIIGLLLAEHALRRKTSGKLEAGR